VEFIIAVAAAGFLGAGFAIQQHAAYREPLQKMLHLGLLIDLIRRPIWLAGVGAMVCGQILGGLALDVADVSLVEPLLATSLIFALLTAHLMYREPVAATQWWGAVLVSGGVAMYLALGQPHGGRPAGPDSVRWAGAAAVLLIAAVLVTIGRRRSLRVRALLLGTSAGVLYGLQDALTRDSLTRLPGGAVGVVTSWQPYVLVAVAVVGLLLMQSAFDAAPLRVSLPAVTAAEPLSGIALGVGVFLERLRVSPQTLAGEVLGLVILVVGIVLLSRSPFLAKSEGDGAAARSERENA
jgi:drug/metabolite transporter (DMT)-like permease